MWQYGFLSFVDTNKNNKISLDEITTMGNEFLGELLREWFGEWFDRDPPIGLQKALQKEIDDVWAKLIKRLDKDYDNQISLHEIKEIMRDFVQLAIRAVDMDGDDKNSFEELKHIVNPDTLPETLMSLFDENSDGELSYTEFKQVGDLDVINTVTQALERQGGGGGMSGGAVAAIVIVSLLLVGGCSWILFPSAHEFY